MVENFRPTVMPKLGFVADDLVAEHPGLIYAALRGFPSDSPLADSPAYDHVIQAMTGFGANQADLRTGVPVLVQQAVVDKVTGLTAAQAITAALFERDPHRPRSGDRDPDAARRRSRSCGPTCRPTSPWSASSTSSRRSHARSGSPRPPTVTSR